MKPNSLYPETCVLHLVDLFKSPVSGLVPKSSLTSFVLHCPPLSGVLHGLSSQDLLAFQSSLSPPGERTWHPSFLLYYSHLFTFLLFKLNSRSRDGKTRGAEIYLGVWWM